MHSDTLFFFLSVLIYFFHNQNLIFEDRRLRIPALKILCCSDDMRRTLACDDFPSRCKGVLSNCTYRLFIRIVNKAKADGRIEGYREVITTRILNTHYFFVPYEVEVVSIARWYHRSKIDGFMNLLNSNWLKLIFHHWLKTHIPMW